MEKVRLGQVTVDRCPRCGGVWLDGGELGTLLDQAEQEETPVWQIETKAGQPPDVRHVIGSIKCPRDGQKLLTVRDEKQPHIEYERCSKCQGMFFDAGELEDLSEFTLAERLSSLLG